jgi:hypothetical protein
MANGDETFKLARQTPKEPIEFNDDYPIPREGMRYENLNAIDKVYACCTDEAWLYEQPQTTMFPIQHINLPNASTPSQTLPRGEETIFFNSQYHD